MTSGAWSADPTSEPETCCIDATCAVCTTKAAGARELGALAGFDYDQLDAHAQHHYREICGAVMAAMSEAMIQTGLATPKETTP